MIIRQTSLVEVRKTPQKGRGVFATQFIPEGTIFERAPVLVMPAKDFDGAQEETVLSHYMFEWGKNTVAVALGFGSLYNHSYSPNARYEDVSRQMKNYVAIRDIQPGEEVTINYNGDASSTEPVWFDVVENASETAATVKKTASAAGAKAKTSVRKNSRAKVDSTPSKAGKSGSSTARPAPVRNSKSKARRTST